MLLLHKPGVLSADVTCCHKHLYSTDLHPHVVSSQESPWRTDLKQEKLTDNGNYSVWQTVLTSQPYHTIYKNFIFPQSLFRAGCTVNQLSGCTTQGKNSPFAPLFDVSESSPSFHQVLLPPLQTKKNIYIKTHFTEKIDEKEFWEERTVFSQCLAVWVCACGRLYARVRACMCVDACVVDGQLMHIHTALVNNLTVKR